MKDLLPRTARTLLVGLILACALPVPAQVLARPGWAGSGVAPESWWRRAVFYRIDPARFQDSSGNGAGDLPGIAHRLDYLQSTGVDAILLDGAYDPDGLDDLIHEGSRHHLRVLLTLTPQAASGPRTALISTVRSWMSAGAAGIWVPKPDGTSPQSYADLLSALRSTLQSFPGERVLLTEANTVPLNLGPHAVHLTKRIDPRSFSAPATALLTAAVPLPITAPPEIPLLRQALTSAAEGSDPAATPLLRFAIDPATGSPDAAAYAALLLASRGAAILNFGDEIGLDTAASSTQTASARPPVMQWTPSNRTPAPIERTSGTAAATPPGETQFGAYHPYIPPPPGGLTGPNPGPPHISVDADIPAALPDPDSLPGFTSGALPTPPVDGARLNVTTQDRNPDSLLNAYRALIGLHHGNATLRNGTQYILNRDAEGALVWIRRAPAGSRTVGNLVVAANLSGKPVTLALDSDIEAQGMRPGILRQLFAFSPLALTGETTARLSLPPHAVFIGEIYHAGASEPPVRTHRPHRRVRR